MAKEEMILNEEEQQNLEENTEKTKEKVANSEKSVRHYQWFILRLAIIIFIIWVLFFQIVGLTHMPNDDMYPRVDSGDLVLFYRLDKDVRSQDIIVFEKMTPDSGKEKELFISRVVGAPGDTVEIDGTRLIINGNTVSESNIFYTTQGYEGYTTYPVTLGPDECFVLADFREGGSDSRYFGPVKQDEILGTVISIFRRNNL